MTGSYLLYRVLQPQRWRCVECVIHHEQDVREEQQYIYLARTNNNIVITVHELYCCLLAKCEALRTCRSGFSDRNTRLVRMKGSMQKKCSQLFKFTKTPIKMNLMSSSQECVRLMKSLIEINILCRNISEIWELTYFGSQRSPNQ